MEVSLLQLLQVTEIFSLCFVTLIMPNSNFDFTTMHPLFVYLEHLTHQKLNRNTYYPSSRFIFENTTLVRTHHEKRFCWASIFLESGSNFYHRDFGNSPLFPKIWGSIGPTYFILMANSEEIVQAQLDLIYLKVLNTDLNFMGNREFCLVEGGPDVTLHYLNRYHLQDRVSNPNPVPRQLIEEFSKFAEISCPLRNLAECYSLLDKNADLVATKFNKYFWTYANWMGDIEWEYIYGTDFRKMQNKYFFASKYPNWFSVADDSKGMDDFIAYTVLSETLYNLTIPKSINFKQKYLYYGSSGFRYTKGNHQIIMLSRKSCSFISCYGIQHEKS